MFWLVVGGVVFFGGCLWGFLLVVGVVVGDVWGLAFGVGGVFKGFGLVLHGACGHCLPVMIRGPDPLDVDTWGENLIGFDLSRRG